MDTTWCRSVICATSYFYNGRHGANLCNAWSFLLVKFMKFDKVFIKANLYSKIRYIIYIVYLLVIIFCCLYVEKKNLHNYDQNEYVKILILLTSAYVVLFLYSSLLSGIMWVYLIHPLFHAHIFFVHPFFSCIYFHHYAHRLPSWV